MAALLAAALAVTTPAAHATACGGADMLPAVASLQTAKSATHCLINRERAARGLAPLARQQDLDSAAKRYSQAMVDGRFFAHVSPLGQDFGQRIAAYARGGLKAAAENLAWGEGVLATPRSIVGGWMHSPKHRFSILDAGFRDIGIGIATGSPVGSLPAVSATYAAAFGARASQGPGRAVASSVAAKSTPKKSTAKKSTTKKKPKRISAATKRRISAQCHRVAKRTKATSKVRKARYNRCVRTRTAAARR
ncbi:MAG: CAP domain-containing protein [Solirubrobacteraceae bacterium]|nr:CAP domain-containing protein [Solirubrobacteraceae bacterium]